MLVLLLLALAQIPPDRCQAASAQAMQQARVLVGRAGPASAQTLLVEVARTDATCTPLLGAGWSITGWVTARAAARAGGSAESLEGAATAIATLETLGTRPQWRVESEYARAAIRAAMAAAQDERSEMAIFLAHARGLSERLSLAQATPEWPLPIDAIEGDLWLEVDRYDEARAAFERARAIAPTGFVLVGLARTRARLGDEGGACDAYREAVEKSERALQAEARDYLKRPGCTR